MASKQQLHLFHRGVENPDTFPNLKNISKKTGIELNRNFLTEEEFVLFIIKVLDASFSRRDIQNIFHIDRATIKKYLDNNKIPVKTLKKLLPKSNEMLEKVLNKYEQIYTLLKKHIQFVRLYNKLSIKFTNEHIVQVLLENTNIDFIPDNIYYIKHNNLKQKLLNQENNQYPTKKIEQEIEKYQLFIDKLQGLLKKYNNLYDHILSFVKKMLDEGYTKKAIAKILGISYSNFNTFINKKTNVKYFRLLDIKLSIEDFEFEYTKQKKVEDFLSKTNKLIGMFSTKEIVRMLGIEAYLLNKKKLLELEEYKFDDLNKELDILYKEKTIEHSNLHKKIKDLISSKKRQLTKKIREKEKNGNLQVSEEELKEYICSKFDIEENVYDILMDKKYGILKYQQLQKIYENIQDVLKK